MGTSSHEKSKALHNSNSRMLISHSSGEISGEVGKIEDREQTMARNLVEHDLQINEEKISTRTNTRMLTKTDTQQQENQQHMISLMSERGGCSTPLPVLSEWLNEDNLKRKQE